MDQKVSGFKIYHAITRIANTMLSTDEVEALQRNWLNMERGHNETIDAWSTRVQTAAQELQSMTITITQADIGRRWRTGLGKGFKEFNRLIRMTNRVPHGWEEDQPLIILKDRAL
eukprot:3265710-Ditylum_brightwellii.AAC.1